MPILTGILLQTEAGLLHLTATDLEIAISATVPCSAGSQSEIVLPARYLIELVRRSPAEKLDLEIREEDWSAWLRWPGSEFRMNGFEPSQFPKLPKVEASRSIRLENDLLLNGLQKTLFSVSQDETRPILTGVQLGLSEEGLEAISTDGFRISHVKLGKTDRADEQLVVPGRSLQQLARVLPAGQQGTIEMGDHQVIFRSADLMFLARTLSDPFPAVLDLIPHEYQTKMHCERRLLLSACERMALVADMRDRPNGVKLSLQQDRLVLRANSPDVGDACEEIPVVTSGDPLEISFNARYLIDGLKVIDDDQVLFEFSGALSAARLGGAEDESYRYIVLPMRTS